MCSHGLPCLKRALCNRGVIQNGLMMVDTPLVGLCSRAVVVISADDKILYTEQVADITSEPNYEAALKTVR